jgi:hypothetical protein
LAQRYRLQDRLAWGVAEGALKAEPGLAGEMHHVRAVTAGRNAALEAQQVRLLEGLDREGIPVLQLKGLSLSRRLYGDIGYRETSDLDLMVRRVDVYRTLQHLAELDYLPAEDMPPLDRFHQVALLYRGNGGWRPSVDLHWALCADEFGPHARFDFSLPEEEVWRHSDPHAHELDDHMRLTGLVLHAFTNAFSRFRDFVDVLHLVHRIAHSLDWSAWARDIARYRLARVAGFLFGRLREWWGMELPPEAVNLGEHEIWLGRRLAYIRGAPFRGDIGGWREKLSMPLFFEPAPRVVRAYLRFIPLLGRAW